MRPLAMLLLIVAVVAAPARADRLDLATVKCKDFFAGGKDNIRQIMMWLEAYYSEENASPIVDFDKLNRDESNLRDYCGKNTDDSLITAAEKLMTKR